MTLFIILALVLAILCSSVVLVPLWHTPTISQQRKRINSLIFIAIILAIGAGLYVFLGAPNIVMFTA